MPDRQRIQSVLQGLQPDLREQAEPLIWEMVEAPTVDAVVDCFERMLRLQSEGS